jgi:glycerophosphoryl diester phosphodiesterase
VARVVEVLSAYRGPVVTQSFDPDQLVALREMMPDLPRGALAQRTYEASDWPTLSPDKRRSLEHLLRHCLSTRPQFIAYWIGQLPAMSPWIGRHVFGLPLLTWTVRTPEQRDYALRHADQIIFEGFPPES